MYPDASNAMCAPPTSEMESIIKRLHDLNDRAQTLSGSLQGVCQKLSPEPENKMDSDMKASAPVGHIDSINSSISRISNVFEEFSHSIERLNRIV